MHDPMRSLMPLHNFGRFARFCESPKSTFTAAPKIERSGWISCTANLRANGRDAWQRGRREPSTVGRTIRIALRSISVATEHRAAADTDPPT